ncbi:PKD domain-containing protein [Sulfurovum sp. CS9]|uniref:PKD domain-containing protein n=1 Tax=Sulfurovum sp. CS9 TaxID=3391146 RepID=UPI0039EA1720
MVTGRQCYSPSENMVVIGRDGSGNPSYTWWAGIAKDTGHAIFSLRDSDGPTAITVESNNSILGNNDGYYISIVRDGSSGETRLYVDGVLQNTTPHTYSSDFTDSSTPAVNIGYLNYNNTPGFFYTGVLDDLAVFQTALSETEINEHYQNGLLGNSFEDLNPPANQPPTADAGPNKTVEVNKPVTITGSGSDTDGTIASYEWKKGTTVVATTASFDYTPTAVGTDTLTLTVTDNDGATGTDSMTVTVTAAPNTPPTADAGPNKTVEVNKPVTITGSGSDTDGTIASYEWKKGGTVLATTASFVYTPTAVGTDTLTLTVTDDDGATGTDSMDVAVTAVPNTPPTANAGPDKTVEVNQPVTITGTGTDTDGTIASYEWKKGSTVLASTASFNYTPDTVGTDTLTLTVTDNDGATGTDSMDVVVSATPPPADTTPPVITLNGSNPMSIIQGSTFTDPEASATDAVDGDVPVSVSGTVDTSTVGTYTLTYSATDTAGNMATETRTVNVVAMVPDWYTVSPDGSTYTSKEGSSTVEIDASLFNIYPTADMITFKKDCVTIVMKSNGEILTGYENGCNEVVASLTSEKGFAPGTKVSVGTDMVLLIETPLTSDLVLGGI